MRRFIGAVTMAALTVGGLAACEPQRPPVELTVSRDGAIGDAVPGDGICETEVDSGWCTLTAAIQEANALGRAIIHVPQSDDIDTGVTDTIVGDITLRGTGRGESFVELGPLDLVVAPGATLILQRLDQADVQLRVQGRLVLDQTGLWSPGRLVVEPGGSAVLVNALLHRVNGEPLVHNKGQLLAVYSSFATWGPAEPAVVTAPGATTTFAATRLVSTEPTVMCSGEEPISLGYNSASDSSCGLTSEGDQPDAGFTEDPFEPFRGSPAIDAIPVGRLGCGEPGAVDVEEDPRPYDGDGDGIAACDIGAWEFTPPS